MGHKPKLNPKEDFNSQDRSNKQNAIDALHLAKRQESKKQLKTVRVDRCTIILVDVGVSEADAVKRFRMNVNQ